MSEQLPEPVVQVVKEKGEKIIGLWVEYIGEFLKEFRKIPIGN